MVVSQEIISIWSCSVGRMWCWWFLLPHSSFYWESVLWFVTYFYTCFLLHWIATPFHIHNQNRCWFSTCKTLFICPLFYPWNHSRPAVYLHFFSCPQVSGLWLWVLQSLPICAPSLPIPLGLQLPSGHPVLPPRSTSAVTPSPRWPLSAPACEIVAMNTS